MIRETKFSERDIDALEFIGRSFEAAQYQLHESVFHGNAPTVVSRFIARAREADAIAIHRHDVVSGNRLRLTHAGLGWLEQKRPAVVRDIFVPRRPVALKDVEHTTFINDIRVCIDTLEPTELHPAWCLQRRLGPHATAIPDVLAMWRPTPDRNALVLACEVDLGCEPLRRVFVPKVYRLAEALTFSSAPSCIAVFTRGSRRRLEIDRAVATPDAFRVFELPSTRGVQSVMLFSAVLQDLVAPLLYATGSSANEVRATKGNANG